jgi:superfamily I DNA and/or RNA helicase
VEFQQIVEIMKSGLDEELEALKNSKPIKLKNLKRSSNGGYFACASPININGDGVCKINEKDYSVFMQSNNGILLIGGLEEIEEDYLREIYIFQDEAALVRLIKDEFAGIKETELHKKLFSSELLKEGDKVFQIEHLNIAQNDSITKAIANETSFIVGPAGTGKTKTIVSTILEMINLGKRVLVCSHANLAVQGAIEDLLKEKRFETGELILSIDTNSHLLKEYTLKNVSAQKSLFLEDELDELTTILEELYKNKSEFEAFLAPIIETVHSADIILANKNREIVEEEKHYVSLEKERQMLQERLVSIENNAILSMLSSGAKKKELSEKLEVANKKVLEQEQKIRQLKFLLEKSTRNISSIKEDYNERMREMEELNKKILLVKNRVSEIKKEINSLVSEDLFSPSLIAGTTLMSAAINKKIHSANFDVLIVDEVSMANVPTLLLAIQHIKEKVILFGDPMQLLPVAKTDTLKTSIYDLTGIKESFSKGIVHPRCVLLDTQYRCRPEIANLNSHLFYGGLLKNGRVAEDDKKALYIKNTHGYGASFKGENGSFVNEVHQKVVIGYVKNALKRGQRSIGVISPYRAQANAIQALFELELAEEYPDADFKAATIHAFQGQEKDVVIFDMTFGRSFYSKNSLPKMLVGDIHSNAACLLNVAGSRARDFFVLVCDLQFTEEKIQELPNSKNMIIGKWLNAIKNEAFKKTEKCEEDVA